MSLASIAFSRLVTKVITPTISWAAAAASTGLKCSGSSVAAGCWGRSSQTHHEQKITISIRSVFSEVIRKIPSDDPKKHGALTFEDPDLADARMGRNIRGESPLRKRIRFIRHEKGWMRRKRLKMERRYLRLQEGVEELKAYIKFKQGS